MVEGVSGERFIVDGEAMVLLVCLLAFVVLAGTDFNRKDPLGCLGCCYCRQLRLPQAVPISDIQPRTLTGRDPDSSLKKEDG